MSSDSSMTRSKASRCCRFPSCPAPTRELEVLCSLEALSSPTQPLTPGNSYHVGERARSGDVVISQKLGRVNHREHHAKARDVVGVCSEKAPDHHSPAGGSKATRAILTLDENAVGELPHIPPLCRPRSHRRAEPAATAHLRERVVIVKCITHLKVDLPPGRV